MTGLAQKLRVPAGGAAVVNAPAGYAEELGVASVTHLADLDFVQLFVRSAAELRSLGPAAIRSVRPGGLLWITYPKGGKTRGETDLPATPWWHRRDVLGEITGETGYVPVAQVAIDDYWTALRFRRTGPEHTEPGRAYTTRSRATARITRSMRISDTTRPA